MDRGAPKSAGPVAIATFATIVNPPLATPTAKRPRSWPSSRWSDYISDHVWLRLGVEPAELSEIAENRKEFWVLLGLLTPRLSW